MSSFIGGSDRRKVRPSRKKYKEKALSQLGNREPEAGRTDSNPMPNGSFNLILPTTSRRHGKAVFGIDT